MFCTFIHTCFVGNNFSLQDVPAGAETAAASRGAAAEYRPLIPPCHPPTVTIENNRMCTHYCKQRQRSLRGQSNQPDPK